MNGIGRKNLQQSLEKFTRLIRDDGEIDVGATAILLPIVNKSWILNQHVGYYVQVYSAASLTYEWSIITANTTNTLSIAPALTVAPSIGDTLVILDISTPSGPAPVVDVSEWGGTLLTGADITGNIQNLDLAITALRNAILGISNNTLTDIVNSILGTTAGEVVTIANNVAINGGVVGTLNNYNKWSLFIYVAAAINITVEISPDAGGNYYDIAESPISFAAAGDEVYEIGYIANRIRLTGSNATLCTIQIRGKF